MKKNLQTAFSDRQYMVSKDFEIYYYNDRKLNIVQKHTHHYYEFYFFLEGDVSITINRKTRPLTPGDVVLLPPGIPHYVNINSVNIPYRRFVLWISEEFYNSLQEQSADYVYILEHTSRTGQYIFHYDVIAFNAFQSKVYQLIEEMQSEHFGKSTKVSLCIKDLLLYLNRSVYEFDHFTAPGREHSLYQNLMQYIEQHLDEDLSLERLATVFYVSKYHISHIFKDNIGISIHQYIMKKRLTACRDAILSNTSISEAYMKCGFKDYSSFYRAFRKEFGISPKEYAALHSRLDASSS